MVAANHLDRAWPLAAVALRHRDQRRPPHGDERAHAHLGALDGVAIEECAVLRLAIANDQRTVQLPLNHTVMLRYERIDDVQIATRIRAEQPPSWTILERMNLRRRRIAKRDNHAAAPPLLHQVCRVLALV